LKKISAASRKIFKLALLAQKNSYSPYSGCRVGAAILIKGGKVFGGCNVENASYGGTICAERTAIFKAISEVGPIQIQEVCVVSPPSVKKNAWPPCGFCRQVIQEFAGPETLITLATTERIESQILFSELFPMGFTPKDLQK
jgi:cytidine deaminase